ncbi:SEC-C domain-containing protein [Patescibacteria group bacterium]|nr:SEC-C domain-containing protein [Patescibacteria group bacterium]
MSFLANLFDPTKKELVRYQRMVEQINSLEPQMKKLQEADFKIKTKEFKKRIKKGETLDEILPEAFALVREAAQRTISQRPFDVQLMGAITLHEGKIAEMKTGEGKTLAATMPLYLNALSGRGAHLVTVNDYLSRWQGSWMGGIYNLLGLSVGVIQQQNISFIYDEAANSLAKRDLASPDKQQPARSKQLAADSWELEAELHLDVENLVPCTRKEAYACDVVYGTNNEFGFDYLRDNMVQNLNDLVQGELNYAVVDEIDSILIDEARTPLIISAPAEESADLYRRFALLVPNLKEDIDFNVDEKDKAATLTDSGIKKMEGMLGVKNIYERGGISQVHHLEQALKAHALFKKDKDYVVKDGEIVIIDEFTGRMMFGRRYSEGLHQAIEAKEGVEVKRESITLATISFQNLFRLYDKLSGMTGTAKTEQEEFHKIYNLDVLAIPTNKPMVRRDLPDRIFRAEEGKFLAVAQEIKLRHKKGQPLLVGTISIEKSERLSRILKREGVKHQILNAKHHEREAKIIARAGEKEMVTIATNMAGRGVDIILGNGVKELGGLHVLGTERHESRRIDNQLRGRTGRQGDPGSTQFYVSMEDDLMRIFGGDRIKALMKTLRVPEDQPLENRFISRSLEGAQEKVEGFNFDIRKHLLEYDDVLNKQREIIYKRRHRILKDKSSQKKYKSLKEEIMAAIKEEIECGGEASAILPENYKREIKKTKSINKLVEQVYQEREVSIGSEMMRLVEKSLMLRSIDNLWIEHLTSIEELRQGIGLRGYGQRDPLTEYKREAYNMFERLIATIYEEVIHLILKVELNQAPTPASSTVEGQGVIMKGGDEMSAAGTFHQLPATSNQQPAGSSKQQTAAGSRKLAAGSRKVGRNEPCPCGSGKKYKKCCGR